MKLTHADDWHKTVFSDMHIPDSLIVNFSKGRM